MIREKRQSAGIGNNGVDPYLEECKGNTGMMRELIHNERRIELCFEGFRFFDLRRWKDDLNVTAKGINISGGSFDTFDVESRDYKEYMYYGPIPYGEVLKFSELKQNAGW